MGDAGTDTLDDAGGLVTQYDRVLAEGHGTVGYTQVRVAETAILDVDAYLANPRLHDLDIVVDY